MRFLLWWFLAQSMTSCYTLKQAYHFNNLFNSRRLVSQVIADPNTPQKVRDKLIYSQKVVNFANSQGLNTAHSYDYYIHLEKDDVSHVVQAAHRDKLKFVRWWFPIVGKVPYLGYFNVEERDRKAVELAKNYDIHKARVGAFSSLGWFHDPIYTSMLRYREADFAHLLFHELTHRTFWSRGSTTFNENLAEFSAGILTEKFLHDQGSVRDIEGYLEGRRDKVQFRKWLKMLRESLSKLYKQNLTTEDKLKKKKIIIERYLTENRPKFTNPKFSRLIDKKEWNNASILAASLYTPDTLRFAHAFACQGEPLMGDFLEAIEIAEEDFDDVFHAMDSLCQGEDVRSNDGS